MSSDPPATDTVHSSQLPHIHLTLIDVSPDLSQSSDVEPLLNEALGVGCVCLADHETIFQSSLAAKKCEATGGIQTDAREGIVKSVMRFVKPQDRYLALGSALLKSRAYHQSLLEEREDGCEFQVPNKSKATLPLVELPRTKYNKPYIWRRYSYLNSQQGGTNDHGEEAEQPADVHHTISISHQYPYVGIARLVKDQQQSSHSHNRPLHVGFDIAMYEKPNQKLHTTTSEFLEVFKDSFTPSEWGCIVDSSAAWFGRRRKSDENSRREFYLRWAVKEAYTKALGLGLGHEFGKFEVVFDCCEDEEGFGGLAEAIGTFGFNTEGSDARADEMIGKRLATFGRIKYTGRDTNFGESGTWHFTFLELQDKPTDGGAIGCACVCLGPLEEDSIKICSNIVQEDILTLEDAIQWHQRYQ